jgi:hypothetical protein
VDVGLKFTKYQFVLVLFSSFISILEYAMTALGYLCIDSRIVLKHYVKEIGWEGVEWINQDRS